MPTVVGIGADVAAFTLLWHIAVSGVVIKGLVRLVVTGPGETPGPGAPPHADRGLYATLAELETTP